MTVTVRKRGQKVTSEFSALPGRQFGPWTMAEMIRDLTVSALLTRLEARDLVLDAAVKGSATAAVTTY